MARAMKASSTQCASAFYRAHIPGRVYIEAVHSDAIYALCSGIQNVILNALTVIQLDERPKLLWKTVIEPVEVCSWVKIKTGRYKDDIGQVVSIDESNPNDLVVKLVPRICLDPSRKRRRKNFREGRHLATFFRISEVFGDDALKRYGRVTDALSISTGSKNLEFERSYTLYKFRGHILTVDGFLHLKVLRSKVEMVRPQLEEVSEFLDAATTRLSQLPVGVDRNRYKFYAQLCGIHAPSLAVPRVLQKGDTVYITHGDLKGATARLVQTSNDSRALLEILDRDGIRDITLPFVDMDVKCIRRKYCVSEEVIVKIGLNTGKHGLIERLEGCFIFIREHGTLEEVRSCYWWCSKLTHNCRYGYRTAMLITLRPTRICWTGR